MAQAKKAFGGVERPFNYAGVTTCFAKFPKSLTEAWDPQ